jgi:hypothetical protein
MDMIVGHQCMLQGMTEDHVMVEVQVPRSLFAELKLPIKDDNLARDVSAVIANRIMDEAGWQTSEKITAWWITCQALYQRPGLSKKTI